MDTAFTQWGATAGQRRIIASEMAGQRILPIGYVALLHGALDIERLFAVLREIIEDYPVLRTRFVIQADEIIQEVVDLNLLESRPSPNTPFDVFTGPLIRFNVLKVREGVHEVSILAHHSILDGWSIHLLGKELASRYSGRKSTLAIRPFSDYARAEQAFVSTAVALERLSFWKDWYGRPRDAALPAVDQSRERESGDRGITRKLTLPALSSREKPVVDDRPATVFETFLAAYLGLMRRLSGNDIIWIELPFADRRSLRNARVLGLLVQMVPMAFTVAPGSTFSSLIQQIRSYTETINTHFLPDIAAAVNIATRQRKASRYHSAFNVIPWSSDRLVFEGLSVEEVACPEAPTDVGLAAYIHEHPDHHDIKLSFAESDFSAEEANEILSQFGIMIEHVLTQPGGRVMDPSLRTTATPQRSLKPEAHDTVLDRAPRSSFKPGPHGTVLDRFLARAKQEPQAVCYRDGTRSISLEEARESCEHIAAQLRQAGVQPGHIVAVLPTRTSAFPVTLLGIWMLRAVPALIDPRLPLARRERQLQRIAPCALIHLPEQAVQGRAQKTSDGALLLFTSGSTGEPKIIESTHAGLAHFLEWQTRTFQVGADDRVSCFSGLAHDPVLRDLFLPVWSGATGQFPEAGADGLRNRIPVEAPTLVHMTPSLAAAVLEGQEPSASLRWVFLGGEPLARSTAERIQQAAPRAQLVNFYGATETPQAMSWHRIAPAQKYRRRFIPVGTGIDDVDLLIINESGELAGCGEPGEIWIDTPYLASGYFEDTAATAQRFLPSPFRPGTSKAYRTGDIGYYLNNGDVQIIGRNDDQLKIDGVRVEPREVTEVLESFEGVQQAYTLPLSDGEGRTHLVSFLVTSRDAAELRARLALELPAASVPEQLIVIDALPLSPNGKVDRPHLREIFLRATAPTAADPPTTETEIAVSAIVCSALGVTAIGRNEDLVALGLRSLQAMTIIAQINSRLAVQLRPEFFLVRPSVAKLAGLVDALRSQGELTDDFEDCAV